MFGDAPRIGKKSTTLGEDFLQQMGVMVEVGGLTETGKG
jgi:hypothetical protein